MASVLEVRWRGDACELGGAEKVKNSLSAGASAGVMAGVASAERAPGVVVPVDLKEDGANEICVGAEEREMPVVGVGVE